MGQARRAAAPRGRPATWPACRGRPRWASRCGGRRRRSAWTAAQRWIALSDGGSGLEDWLGTNFGRVEAVILDFYHASEYLGDLAKACARRRHGGGRRRGIGEWSHRLKHEGGRAVLDELRGLTPAARRSAREVWRGDGDLLREPGASDGLPERTGPRVGRSARARWSRRARRSSGQRLKGAGMRWGEPGSDGVCHLRALFLSEKGQWDAFWAEHRGAA